ncbi:MAG: hypothetical protein EBW42_10380, partial [Rhodobacterales bacterium]|nr:hypothetical protein [Rhodobacterales bacterium]
FANTGGFSDDTPPTQNNSPEQTFYQPYRDMIYGKQVTTNDIKHMVANNQWVANTVYAQYDHRDGELRNKKFFVHTQENVGADIAVFKCLGNNKGKPSVDQPILSETAANDDIYITTTDRYQWKLMYTIPEATYKKFVTSKKIPIVDNANVSGNAVAGAIDFVAVNSGGSRYNSVANGVVKVVNVGSNTRMIEIESLVSANVSYSQTNTFVSGTFSAAEKIDLLGAHSNGDLFDDNNAPNGSNNVANAVSIEANTSQLRVVDIAGNFFGNSQAVVLRGASSNATALITDIVSETSTLSANTDFYKGSTFYITAGSGAGAAATISEYIVTGSARRVLIANDVGFANSSGMIIDTTSRFEITPSVTISGDGQGAEGRAIVNTSIGSVDTIEITKRGSGYTYADAIIVGNTGIVGDLSADNANCTVIIGPKGGHGSDPINELYSDTVGISVDFANSENGTTPANNDFRQVGILKDPLFSNVVITLANTIGSTGSGSVPGTSFQDEEVVTQSTSGAFGVVTSRAAGTIHLANVYGQFLTTTDSNTTHRIVGGTSNVSSTVASFKTSDKNNSTFSTFDQRTRLTGFAQTTTDAAFSNDEIVIQASTNATGIVHSINTGAGASVLTITNKKGNWLASDTQSGTQYSFTGSTSGASGTFTGRSGPDIVPNTGEVIYIENLTPITRSDDQTERIKLMIEF